MMESELPKYNIFLNNDFKEIFKNLIINNIIKLLI